MSEEKQDKQLRAALEGDNSEMNLQNIINFVWRLKWWILVSVVLALAVAHLYAKYQTPSYKSTAKVMMMDERNGSTELSVLADLTGSKQTKRIDDEIFILQSQTLMSEVVSELGLNIRYFQKNLPLFRSVLNVKNQELYLDSPVTMDLMFDRLYSSEDLPKSLDLELSAVDDTTYSIKSLLIGGRQEKPGGSSLRNYGDTLAFSGISFCMNRNKGVTMANGGIYQISYQEPSVLGAVFSSKLSASIESGVTGRMSNVISLSLEDSNPVRCSNVLNTLIGVYNRQAREYKSQATLRSLDFITDRVSEISQELGQVETNYRDYQSTHNFVIGSTEGMLSSDADFDAKLADLRMQITFLDMVKKELSSLGPDEYSVIPANIGIADSGLNQMIVSYNTLVIERNRLLANSSDSNPSVINYGNQVKNARLGIEAAIRNLEQVYSVRESELVSRQKSANTQRSYIPVRQFDLAQIERKQQIIEPMFISLNQKREELQLSLFSVTDNVRVIEPAKPNYGRISPNVNRIYLLAILIGCLLPIGLLAARRLMRTRVESNEDIKKYITSPIVATIPKNHSAKLLAVGSRDAYSEAFRMLRSNLQFMPGKVIQVTSSVSGEGKSTVSANLAISLSHIGKRVILLGLDLRKPSLQSLFPECEMGTDTIVSYLIGKTDNPSKLVNTYRNGDYSLDIMFSGVIPPNPSELLSMDMMGNLIDYCKANYDFVICDTPPFFPVSDSSIINKYVDRTIYVIRSDYTQIRMLHDISISIDEGPVVNAGVVLNGVEMEAKKYKYGYGNGYGYGDGRKIGYGYGYGYGYAAKSNKVLSNKIKDIFKK